MNINSNSISNLYTSDTSSLTKSLKDKENLEAKSSEKSTVSTSSNDAVIYEKSTSKKSSKTSGKDRAKIQNLISQAERQSKNFEKLVSSIFQKQSNKVDLVKKAQNNNLKGFFSSLKVDMATVAKAKKDIAEDGYYGVKQTSERILGFAKAVAGNDKKELVKMRDAVEKGFKQAERMWGGELPDISKETYDVVMSTFDKWESEAI